MGCECADNQQSQLVPERPIPVTPPSMLRKVSNFLHAVTKYVFEGMPNVREDEYNARVSICHSCEHLAGDRCLQCGCMVDKKAFWATEDCPIGKWPTRTAPITAGCHHGKIECDPTFEREKGTADVIAKIRIRCADCGARFAVRSMGVEEGVTVTVMRITPFSS